MQRSIRSSRIHLSSAVVLLLCSACSSPAASTEEGTTTQGQSEYPQTVPNAAEGPKTLTCVSGKLAVDPADKRRQTGESLTIRLTRNDAAWSGEARRSTMHMPSRADELDTVVDLLITTGTADGLAQDGAVSLGLNGNQLEGTSLGTAASPVFAATWSKEGVSVPVSCWFDELALAFRYDATSGRCLDKAGQEGRNELPIPVIRATRNGECANLEGDLGENAGHYSIMDRWNLAGAKVMSKARFFGNLILNADMRGADMGLLQFSYGLLTGQTDERTILPDLAVSTPCVPHDGGKVSCGDARRFCPTEIDGCY
jgi:hypothetical protein